MKVDLGGTWEGGWEIFRQRKECILYKQNFFKHVFNIIFVFGHDWL